MTTAVLKVKISNHRELLADNCCLLNMQIQAYGKQLEKALISGSKTPAYCGREVKGREKDAFKMYLPFCGHESGLTVVTAEFS